MKLATLRPYRPGDENVRFRDEDEAEVSAASGGSCADAVRTVASPSLVQVALDPTTGEPFAFFGMAPVDEVAGAVWMLGTDGLARNPYSVAKITPQVIQGWHAQRPLLFNYVDARNALHIRWLKRLGFVFIRLHPEWGVECRPFYEFVRINHV